MTLYLRRIDLCQLPLGSLLGSNSVSMFDVKWSHNNLRARARVLMIMNIIISPRRGEPRRSDEFDVQRSMYTWNRFTSIASWVSS